MPNSDLEATTRSYLTRYDQRDLQACMSFFAEEAEVHFAMGTYRGPEAIEEWHRDRFEADLRVLEIERVKVQDQAVILDLVATSKTSRAWGFETFAGRATVSFDQGKIVKAEFGLRNALPLEGW